MGMGVPRGWEMTPHPQFTLIEHAAVTFAVALVALVLALPLAHRAERGGHVLRDRHTTPPATAITDSETILLEGRKMPTDDARAATEDIRERSRRPRRLSIQQAPHAEPRVPKSAAPPQVADPVPAKGQGTQSDTLHTPPLGGDESVARSTRCRGQCCRAG